MAKKAEKTQSAKKCKYQLIQNNINRNNTKCKRKSNLFKKSMQLSKLCGQDILLIIYDEEFQKVYQYRSNENFDVNRAKELLESGTQANEGANKRRKQQAAIKVFDYSNKDIKKFAKDDDGDDDIEEDIEEQKDQEEVVYTQISKEPAEQSFAYLGSKRKHSDLDEVNAKSESPE